MASNQVQSAEPVLSQAISRRSPDPVLSQATSNKPNNTPELSGSNTERSQLGVDFQPSPSTVICGRGKDRYVTFDYDSRERWMQYAMQYIYQE
jgi:hypothetical protein